MSAENDRTTGTTGTERTAGMSEKVVGVDMGTGPSWAVRVTMEDGKVVGIQRRMELVQWPRARYWDKPFNPWIGCKPISPACEHCYARTSMVDRFGQSFEPHKSKKQAPPRTGVVFAGNMTDLFGDWVDEFLPIFAAAGQASRLATAFLWLTKRTGNMCAFLNSLVFGAAYTKPERVCKHYFGFTAENQEWFDRRQKESMGMPTWANMWYSLEPLLGPIQMGAGLVRSNLKWVVVGAESGPHRRPCGLGWVESVVAQCLSAGVPVFVKQICLPDGRFTNKIEEFPAHLRIRQVPWKKEEA